MNNKHLYILFILLKALLFSFNGNAQSIKPIQLLKKVNASVDTVRTVIYKINHIGKHYKSEDTNQEVAICSLYVASKNKKTVYHIVDKKTVNQGHYSHYIYDGNHTGVLSYTTDSLDVSKKMSIYNVSKNNHEDTLGMGTGIVLRSFFNKRNVFKIFKYLIDKSFYIKTDVAESMHLNQPVYILTIYGNPVQVTADYINYNIYKIYIRKSDYLPIAYGFYGEFEGMKSNFYFEIEYLEINPKLSLDDFKVDTKFTEIKPRSYYEKLHKYGFN